MEAFASIVLLVIAMFVYAGFTAAAAAPAHGTLPPQLITAPRTGHSRKPEAFVSEIIESLLRSRGRSSGSGSSS